MADAFLGEIRAVGFNFVPIGWALCDGRLLSIEQFQALFTLIGTLYGGDGVTTFGLPDLRDRVPIGSGQGPGLSNYDQGVAGGQPAVALTKPNLPAHTHQARGSSAKGNKTTPAGNSWATDAAGRTMDYQTGAPDGTMLAEAVAAAGGDVPHNNLQPFLTIQYIIYLAG